MFLSIASLASSLPTASKNLTLTDFFLVTTTQNTPSANSSLLANVSATSFFDPYDQQPFLLRLIGPGYEGLPTFNLTSGILHSLTEGIEGSGPYVYNSTQVETNRQFRFLPENEPNGTLGLDQGFLLSVAGQTDGWTLCLGPIGETVVSFATPTILLPSAFNT